MTSEDLRLKFHEELCTLLGSRDVYFNPDRTVNMNYPCIVYNRDTVETVYADDRAYVSYPGYSVTAISIDPDNPVIDAIMNHFAMARYSRHYVADNLNHDVFYIYYTTGGN